MAIVRTLELLDLGRDTAHTEAECTYSVVVDAEGKKYLQVDTYGSSGRQVPGKKSQSIRFSPEAVIQLKEVLKSKF